jgi:hypothetical protein
MTAFEVLLNTFFETIEKNEPHTQGKSNQSLTHELNRVMKDFVHTSFTFGHNLSYKSIISELIETGAKLLKNSNHEEWERVRYIFIENDLHILRRDRNSHDVQNLKMRLEQNF